MVQGRYLIAGERKSEGSIGSIQVHSPYNGEVVGSCPLSGIEDADRAIGSAIDAFPSFRRSSRLERKQLLTRIAALARERAETLSLLASREIGKPYAWARAEVDRLALTFELSATLLDASERTEIDLNYDSRGQDYKCFVEREPVGVVLAIVPYNWPYNLTAHKLAPALAAGCPVVLKSSPLAPLCTFALVDLLVDAGTPSGVVNAILCDNDVAERMVRDERVTLVSFTGSERVGWHIKSLVPEKRVVLELGGDASTLVFEDADLDLAATRTVLSAYGYAGQVCISAQHVRAHTSVYNEIRERLIVETEAIVSGDPLDENVVCGPVINADAAGRVMEWIDESERAGATVLTGGNRIGNVVEPTLIENVGGGCKLAAEEVFGPVLTLSSFETEEEAFAMTNRSRFGIHCSVFTIDTGRIERAFRALEVSGVVINDYPTLRFDKMPYGGVKRSGFGREGVRYAYDEMTTPKVMLVRS